MQPWIYQHAYGGTFGTSFKKDPQHFIERTARSAKGKTICWTGASADGTGGPTTGCGTVKKTGLRAGNEFVTEGRNNCAIQGDSGGPAFEGHTAYGLVTRAPENQKRDQDATCRAAIPRNSKGRGKMGSDGSERSGRSSSGDCYPTSLPSPTTQPSMSGRLLLWHARLQDEPGTWTGLPTIQYASVACTEISSCGTLSDSPTPGVESFGGDCFTFDMPERWLPRTRRVNACSPARGRLSHTATDEDSLSGFSVDDRCVRCSWSCGQANTPASEAQTGSSQGGSVGQTSSPVNGSS